MLRNHLPAVIINTLVSLTYILLMGVSPFSAQGMFAIVPCLAAFGLMFWSKGLAVTVSYAFLAVLLVNEPAASALAIMFFYGTLMSVYSSDRLGKTASIIISVFVTAFSIGGRYLLKDVGFLSFGESGYSSILISCGALIQMLIQTRVLLNRRDNMKTIITTSAKKSETDPLTGLSNRQTLNAFIKKQSEMAAPFSIVMMDIDHFKQVNDTYGHTEGDKILRTLSYVIRQSIRATDKPFRYGGEEFCVVCPQTTEENARDMAERIRLGFKALPYDANGEEKHFTISLGVAECRYGMFEQGGNTDEARVKALIDRADTALYVAKKNGRNRTVVYNSSMKGKA